MNVTPCRPYHAKQAGQALVRPADGRSVFKVYYISIVGRAEPERYEWDRCPVSRAAFESALAAARQEGVGFVTAFPHITKVFRFSPKAETVLDVKAFDTATMRPLDLARGEGWCEFACYAEAAIAAEEYRAWAAAASVEEYLAFRCAAADFPVASHTKMATYWNAAP